MPKKYPFGAKFKSAQRGKAPPHMAIVKVFPLEGDDRDLTKWALRLWAAVRRQFWRCFLGSWSRGYDYTSAVCARRGR